MAITKEKKTAILSKLEGIVKEAATIVFVGFKGLTVKETTTMRRALREKGVGYMVAKKTLIKKAIGARGYEGEIPSLDNEIAIAWSTDEITPAQGVREFEKQHKEKLSIMGGIFGGAFKNKTEMTEIASIPGMQALRGMFAQLVNSPRQRFAVVLSKVAETKQS